ncbi:MAG: hypothetical protein US54_C0013G0005 [Candidatus Roizmanbacteria bacterium GW2011_GWA2_37_7]|uniref:Uncharacterized protein n=1 Tax=Candidatus Roizmanbacteria bacterium GW2011_GWA2_37_7 TaxID=1618481 RepID=A0A0G0H810_9BACT|nr:MAG: hypothetical protein US54_C0013G0005 [Candidatus Roizmanbacteria bacterium GW2011_GWA2_37_7]
MNITIENLTFLLTLLALYFAYYQWVKTAREKRNHLLKVLKVQLDCLGPWMGSTGSGYGEELTEEQKFDNANPFKLIYETSSEALITLNMLDNITNVEEETIGELNQLYYDLVRIKNIQAFRNGYILSDIDTSNALAKKIKDYLCNNQIKSFIKFVKTVGEENEKIMLERLVRYGKILHCEVIGNKDRAARQHWEKLQGWVKKELVPKNDYIFNIITFVFLLGTAYGLNLFHYSNIYFWLAIFLIELFISMSNGALDWTLLKYKYKRSI